MYVFSNCNDRNWRGGGAGPPCPPPPGFAIEEWGGKSEGVGGRGGSTHFLST